MTLSQFTDRVHEYEAKFLPLGQIVDGLFDIEAYFNSPLKIAWLLKEGYTEESLSWHISKLYNPSDPYHHFFKGPWRQTWHPIIYATYSALNGFPEYNQMDYIRDNPDMCQTIKSMAFINANKWASKTGVYTTHANLLEGFNRSWDITQIQLDALKPDVLIFGGTFHLYREKLSLDSNQHYCGQHRAFGVWKKGKQIFIEATHPAQRSIKKEEYINSIIHGIKAFQIMSSWP